jgi:hypothetical protein
MILLVRVNHIRSDDTIPLMAEEGCNDDLGNVPCNLLLVGRTGQYFKEMTDNDVRKRIYEEQKNQIEQDMAPFGFIMDGLDEMMFCRKNNRR